MKVKKKFFQRLKNLLSGNSEKEQVSRENEIRERCYKSFDDIPIWNWNEIFKTADLGYLFKIKESFNKENEVILNKIYEEIYNGYLAEFGLNEKAQEIRDVRQKYNLSLADFLEGDKGAATFIDIYKQELDQLLSSHLEKQSIWELKSKMEVALKINIDVKKCSGTEFYSYLKIIQEMNEKVK